MTKLDLYLQDKSAKDFAAAIGCSVVYLSQIRNKHKTPSYKMMLKIEEATEGFVDLRAWAEVAE